MSRLLVTGGAGFIGANFVHYWLANHPGDRLVVLDALTYAGNRANLAAAFMNDDFRFVRGDIRDTNLVAELLREEHLDTIVHLAAESHVDRSISGPDAFVDVNIGGTYSLLKAARSEWIEKGSLPQHRFHHVSTDEVFGSLGPDDPAFHERTPYTPNSPYAASKAASDHLVRAYQKTFGLQTSMSNCSNNYGPFQFPEKLIPLCIVNLLEGKDLPIYGDGRNVRDWLHVDDHCRGIDAILHRGQVGCSYNIGTDNELTNLALVRELCRLMDLLFAESPGLKSRFPKAPPANNKACDTSIRFVRDRPGHDQRYAIDSRRIQADLDFQPSVDFASGLATTVRWYLDHEDWWRSVMDESYRDWIETQYHD